MKMVGYLLLTAGFLAAAVVAVQTQANIVDWKWFVPAALLAAIGVALARYGMARQAKDAISQGGGLRPVVEAMTNLVAHARTLEAERETLDPYAFHGRIDELFLLDLATFVDHRKRIADIHGLQSYAEVMNEFAAGERYLNRVWSASVDGYIDEIQEYVKRCRTQFERAEALLQKLEAA